MPITPQDVIAGFVARRNELLGAKHDVTVHPDKTNRKSKDVDALATADGAPALAIEHTRLETYRKQIQDEETFARYVVPIQAALRGGMVISTLE